MTNAYNIRPITSDTRELATTFIIREWQTAQIMIRGEIIDCSVIAGFVALDEFGKNVIGLATYIIRGDVCEIVSLNSERPRTGLGTALIDRIKQTAIANGCTILRLLTSNDNINAIGFYQKRGFDMVGLNLGAIDRERASFKPEIPYIGQNGIPLHHEIDFAMKLEGSSDNGRNSYRE
jgi:GNAT superfamily N-acetyltransferase